MTFATGGFHGLRYVPEATFGTTPSTPAMVNLRHTDCSLVLSKDSFQSNELRADRQVSDMRHGILSVGGSVGFEFSYGEFDPLLEGAMFAAWNTNVLKAGVTSKFFTMERAFADITQYGVFTGCMVNTFSLSVTPNAMVTGSFDLIGKGASYSGTPLDASVTASQTNAPFDSFTGTIEEGGSAIASITGIELSLSNGLEATQIIGSNTTPHIVPMRSNLTGTVSAYFENLTMLNKFINETESSIEFTLGNGTSKSYTFLIPRVKYSGADNPTSGEGPIVISMPFQALYDTTTATNIQITRIPGA